MRRHTSSLPTELGHPTWLIASWTLVEDDWRLVGSKTGAMGPGFAAPLKLFEVEGRFPCHERYARPGVDDAGDYAARRDPATRGGQARDRPGV